VSAHELADRDALMLRQVDLPVHLQFTIEAKAPVDVTNAGLAGGSSRSLASLP
jgi:hypothetical protein